MRKSAVFASVLMLAAFSLIFNIQRLQTGSDVSAQGVSVPPFVTENKIIYETGALYQWLDPHVSYYQFDYWMLWHSVETLLWYERDNAMKIVPWLAESIAGIKVAGEVKQYDVTLRQGITFQDGTPFNATAVWFSLNRLLIIDGTDGDGLNHGSQAAWIVQQLLNGSLAKGVSWIDQPYDAAWVQAVLDQNFVEILDAYHVRLNIMTATTQFYPILAGPWAGIVSPSSTIAMDYEHGGWGTWNGDYDTYFEHLAGNGHTGLVLPENGWQVGSGPYYVESIDATEPYTIILKAYDDYWGGPDNMNLPPAGKTRIETIEFKCIPSLATRLLDLEAGNATGIAVPADNIFQVVDYDKWINEGVFESIIPDVTMHGPCPQLWTYWLCYNTNVTNVDGTLKDWQPFADRRIRMAVACSVNMTDMNINGNNRLGVVANSIVPPGTYPPGSYNPGVKPTFSFDLTRVEELLLAARDAPLTSFTFYNNGTAVPPGTIDNSFGPSYAAAKTVEFYVQSGADQFQAVLTQMANTLNAICITNGLGIRFNVVIVPSGQQYTLASAHRIDSYVGGWIPDYNHVLNWLAPTYLSTGTYFSWNLWNLTALDTRYADALLADQAGDVDELLRLNDEMNLVANDALTYMVWWHPTVQFARSTWLQGWYVNANYGVDLWSTMYYENPAEQFDLTIEVVGSGTTDPSVGVHTYDADSVVSVDAIPSAGWMLDRWELDGVAVGAADPYSVSMDADHALTAVFAEIPAVTYDLTIEVVGSGSTDPVPGVYTYDAGSVVDVDAVPAGGWMLDRWELDSDDVGAADPYSVSMDADHALTAVFVEVPPNALIASFVCSSIEPQMDEAVTFDASASDGPVGGIVSYTWNFGDGTTGTGEIAYHAYAEAGTYHVYLTVEDAAGNSDTSTVVIRVGEAAAAFPLWVLVPIVGGIAGVTAVSVYLRKRKPKEKAPKPAKLRITAEPTQILADGKAKSTITIRLVDEEDKPIVAPAATEVKLAATGGKIASPLVQVPKGKDVGKTFLVSSTESGTINVSADAKGLKSMAITLEFVEKPRFCMGCGNRMSVTAKKCEKCGASPQQFVGTAKACKNCERRGQTTYIPKTAEFCSECGASQPKQGE